MSDVFSQVSYEVPTTFPAPDLGGEGVKSLFFEGPAYKGNPTKVFAFCGFPKNVEGPVPGMVLVNGGGGTAFADWVRLWNSRGYAAIAFDTYGALPIGKMFEWERNPEGGPANGGVEAVNDPVEDQWMYHAVSNVVRANSLLRSFPQVDSERTGITGISWGAVITCNAAPVDGRFLFAAPVYGCGYISHPFTDGTQFVGKEDAVEKVQKWCDLWDPVQRLPRLTTPLLWVTGTNDFAFTLRAVMLSADLAPGASTFCIRPRMVHGHEGPGENPEEIRALADHFLKGHPPLHQVTEDGWTNGEVWVEWESTRPIKSVKLNYTRDSGNWQERNWEEKAVESAETSTRAAMELPEGTVSWYFNIEDEGGLIVSSPVRLASGSFAI